MSTETRDMDVPALWAALSADERDVLAWYGGGDDLSWDHLSEIDRLVAVDDRLDELRLVFDHGEHLETSVLGERVLAYGRRLGGAT